LPIRKHVPTTTQFVVFGWWDRMVTGLRTVRSPITNPKTTVDARLEGGEALRGERSEHHTRGEPRALFGILFQTITGKLALWLEAL